MSRILFLIIVLFNFLNKTYATPATNSQSWNCINDACVDPQDGSGTYSSLADCENMCAISVGCTDSLANNFNALATIDDGSCQYFSGIRVHDQVDMNMYGSHKQWAVFPDGSDTYRKIMLHYTMGCASSGCSGWNYPTQILLSHPTGTYDSTYNQSTSSWDLFEIIEKYELGRAVSPYGTYMQSPGSNGYDPSWSHVYSYDITDFAHLLKDSVEIDAFYSGWSSGFSVTTDFEFIEGIPPRNVLKVSNIYKTGAASYSYSSSSDFETNQMPAKTVATMSDAEEFEFRFTPSGHGQDGEFTPGIFYYLNIDGNTVGSNEMWKDDCGLNAIYPQGGTWIFNRANCCPGESVSTFRHDLTPYITPGSPATFDMDFTAFNPTNGASYTCAMQFFQFEAANFTLNAEVLDIVSPSNKDIHSRFNPVCGNPKIVIKNLGSTTLTTLDIEYEMEGGTTETYAWTGNLAYLQSEEVILPSFVFNGTENVFNVRISNPNGGTDQQEENDFLSSPFEIVPDYPNEFNISINSNNFGYENSFIIKTILIIQN